MLPLVTWLLLLVAVIGHTVVWVGGVNRAHAVAWPRWIIDLVTGLSGLALIALPALVWLALRGGQLTGWAGLDHALRLLGWLYVATCVLAALYAAVRKWSFRQHRDGQHGLLSNHTKVLDLRQEVGHPLAAPGVPRLLASLPRNEILTPHIHHKELELPRWRGVGGIKIAHLTDFHMSGRIDKAFFMAVTRHVNAWEPDLIVLTGDLVERPQCIDWIGDTLGGLQAPGGVFFVLGNHDHRAGIDALRSALTAAGLVNLGGAWREVNVGEVRLILAGNELPWLTPAADLSAAPTHDDDEQLLRILLAHSPDQFDWAVQRNIDLMLAGHNHGGQVCFPVVGPILAPSVHGTRYAAGVFRREKTVLHVSRGTCGLAPFRWGCPPEIALLTLQAGGEER